MPVARPVIEITKKMITDCEKLASKGLTLEQISHCVGISYDTLNKNKKLLPELNEAIKRGQASGIEQITNALFNKALDGDNTSMIFYLKNRDQANWGERPIEQETTVESLTINFQVAAPVAEMVTTIGKAKNAKD
jgi:hypothetical protein